MAQRDNIVELHRITLDALFRALKRKESEREAELRSQDVAIFREYFGDKGDLEP